MDIDTRVDPTLSYSKYKSFAVVPVNKEQPLIEKHLLLAAVEALTSKGFVYNEKNPDFLVTVGFGVKNEQKYVPARSYSIPKYTPGQTTYHSGTASAYGTGGYATGTYSGFSQSSGTWTQEEHRTEAYYKKVSHRLIQIYMYDRRRLIDDNDTTPIWKNLADVTHVEGPSTSRMDKYGPFVVQELLQDFPDDSGKGGKRKLRIKNELID